MKTTLPVSRKRTSEDTLPGPGSHMGTRSVGKQASEMSRLELIITGVHLVTENNNQIICKINAPANFIV